MLGIKQRIPQAMLTWLLYFDLWITTALEGTMDSGFRMLNSGFGRFRCWRLFHSSNVISWTTSIVSPSGTLEIHSRKVKTISLQHASTNKNTKARILNKTFGLFLIKLLSSISLTPHSNLMCESYVNVSWKIYLITCLKLLVWTNAVSSLL